MTRCVIALAAALLAGCASFEKKPPPDDLGAAPPEAAAAEEPVAAPEPAPAKPVEAPRPPEPAPIPTVQELPGSWSSVAASGPGSAPVRRVEMEFGADGSWCGSMLLEVDGEKRFRSLEGRWAFRDGRVTVSFADTRVRTWDVAWDGGTLVLRDGEAELRLERAARK